MQPVSRFPAKLLPLLPVLVFLAGWEASARLFFADTAVFPPFSVVCEQFFHMVAEGVLLRHFLHSLLRVLAGFFLGAAAGLLAGALMGWKKSLRLAFHPIFSILYPIPALGWLPLFLIWFGIGELLPVAIVFVCAFFPILYNTISGISSVDGIYPRAAQTLGASNTKILLTVLLPMALPHIFTGLRLEAGLAWRVIIAAEMVAIPTGIGALMMKAESLIRIDVIIVCLLLLALMCFAFESLFLFLERRLTGKWIPHAGN
jgi:NitT/TauT family transport system permease protein